MDYCLPTSPDLLSVEAVQAGLVRRDASGQEVMGALPAYITAEHFERCAGGGGGVGWGGGVWSSAACSTVSRQVLRILKL